MNNQDELLTVGELAAWLKMTPAQVYFLNQKGTGPARHRLGKSLRYRRGDVDEWLASRRLDCGQDARAAK